MPFSFADLSCPRGRRPTLAIAIAGNLRAFTDKRVYMSIRHNLIDALGANATIFAYGKRANERQMRGFDPSSSAFGRFSEADTEDEPQAPGTSDAEIRRACDYLSHDGGPRVVARFTMATPTGIVNNNCSWYRAGPVMPGSSRRYVVLQFAYVAQLHALAHAFAMICAHEQQHGLRFSLVARVRFDTQWWQSAPPVCFLDPKAAYTSGGDHFSLMPREKAESAMALYATYRRCGNALPPTYLNEQVTINCCGGGPTALFQGAIRRTFPLRASIAETLNSTASSTEPAAAASASSAADEALNHNVALKPGSATQVGLWSPLILRIPGSETLASLRKTCRSYTLGYGEAHSQAAVFPDIETCVRALRPASFDVERIVERDQAHHGHSPPARPDEDMQCESINGASRCERWHHDDSQMLAELGLDPLDPRHEGVARSGGHGDGVVRTVPHRIHAHVGM